MAGEKRQSRVREAWLGRSGKARASSTEWLWGGGGVPSLKSSRPRLRICRAPSAMAAAGGGPHSARPA